MQCKIRKMDHSGDSVIAMYDPNVAESVTVAKTALSDFWQECIAEHGTGGSVWGRLNGERNFDPFDPSSGDLTTVEEVLVGQPLQGG